jgi:hypothetical protein
VQKIITTEKGVAIDFDSVSRDSKAQSKELYTWGQSEAEDIKDVTDRLAYLNFVQGSLANSLAIKLDSARGSLKALRDAENALTPRRNIRAGFGLQISRIEHEQQKGNEKKLAELREQLKKLEADDESAEKEVLLLKRTAVRQSEKQKWDALREYGEKLVLIAQAATPIVSVLPSVPPTSTDPYKGAQTTAATRASLQRALDNYKTGHVSLPAHSPASELSRTDTQSFGESHASELSSISSAHGSVSTLPLTPPPQTTPLSQSQQAPPQSFDSEPNRSSSQSPPINTAMLNNAPARIPSPVSVATATSAPVISPELVNPTATMPASTPTVAETGVPVSAGNKGPGPASGSLYHIHDASTSAGPKSGGLPGRDSTVPGTGYGEGVAVASPAAYESAEEEKKRLQREDRERVLAAQGGASPAAAPAPAPAFESAEDEKKRLERERRERREKVLREGGSGDPPSGPKKDDEDLPPYQDV